MKSKIMMAVIAASGFAGAVSIPQAPVVTYGMVRDEYGSPLKSASAAEMRMVRDADPSGKVYASTAVIDAGVKGYNYVLQLEIDSEGPNRPYAVISGTPMTIQAFVGGFEVQLAPTPKFVTPVTGTAQRLDFTIGADVDGDGLPDAWEQLMMSYNEHAGEPGQPSTIAEFRPGDDSDGDGMTNLQEYQAGTDPFLATDLLKIVSIEKLNGCNRAKIRFSTADARKYRVLTTKSLENPQWEQVPTSKTLEGELGYEVYEGTGREISVYTNAEFIEGFYRVAAN